jgi:transcriptional regulator with XRE-family HTH domain
MMVYVKRRLVKPNLPTPASIAMGRRIAEARVTRRKITQGELGKEVGAGTITISRLELGKRNPSDILLHKLASALGCSVAYLRGETNTFDPLVSTGAKGEVMASAAFKMAPEPVKVWFSRLERLDGAQDVFSWFIALQLGISLHEKGILPAVDRK